MAPYVTPPSDGYDNVNPLSCYFDAEGRAPAEIADLIMQRLRLNRQEI
jgi:hypothetical protein